MDKALQAIIRTAYQNLKDNTPNFKDRSTQRKMIGSIATALIDSQQHNNNNTVLVVEAPTGTGKTFAYLTAAVPAAHKLGKHLIVSTATVALQEQLIHKDLPRLSEKSGLDFSYHIAKGRQRYICIHRLKQLFELVPNNMDVFNAGQGYEERLINEMSLGLEAKWNGERESWPAAIPGELWTKVTTNSHGCLGKRCQYYIRCPYYKARSRLYAADVIVTNHDLLLSDIQLGGGVILPSPEESFYIFDEAHHLHDKGISHFSASAGVDGVISWLKQLPNTAGDAQKALEKHLNADTIENSVLGQVERIIQTLQNLMQYLQSIPELNVIKVDENESVIWRFDFGITPEPLMAFGESIVPDTRQLIKTFSRLKMKTEEALEQGQIDEQQAAEIKPNLGFFLERLENLNIVWALLLTKQKNDQPPIAKWVLRADSDFRLHVSPVSVSSLFQDQIWKRCAAAILTSATLTACGSFDKLLQDVGLNDEPDVKCMRLPSPFDYQNNAKLVIPRMQASPKQQMQHTAEIIKLLPDYFATAKGVLVIYASRRQMQSVFNGLDEWQQHILLQGDLPKYKMLEMHEQKIIAKQNSILFGLASFAEGIDLPGALCTHVIIAKIPFSVPDSPIDATYAEWLEKQGRNPFKEVSIPQAAVKLTQAVGRLLRTEDDTGQVTILDNRLIDKYYGKMLLQALPPMPVVIGEFLE